MNTINPSPQQFNVGVWAKALDVNGLPVKKHGSVRACAGSGKTTLLAYICSLLSSGQRIVAMSFGKEASENLAAKLPFYVESTTTHKYWFAELRKKFGRVKIEDRKSHWILKDLIPDWKERSQVQPEVLKLVSYAKACAYGCGGPDLQTVADTYGMDLEPQHFGFAEKVLARAADETYRVDFDDMLWMALRHNVKPSQVDWAMVDEAQDLNLTQRLLLPSMLHDRSRLLIVGDPHQAIYGFRGAGTSSMEEMEREFNMEIFPLSFSYRCSKAVVKKAQQYV